MSGAILEGIYFVKTIPETSKTKGRATRIAAPLKFFLLDKYSVKKIAGKTTRLFSFINTVQMRINNKIKS